MKNIIFTVRKMNWGQFNRCCGEWLDTKWEIYNDGSFSLTKHYDSCTFGENLPDRIVTFTSELDPMLFNHLKKILENEFSNCEDCYNGCDGTGWEMCTYNSDGTIMHKVVGYADYHPILSKIISCL